MSHTPQLDIVTIGFTGEMRSLQLQARSLRMFADPAMISRIYIVCNDKAFKPFTRFVKKHVMPEYGPLANRVTVLNYVSVAGERIQKTGWRSQQALKLLMARLVEGDQFLILDSKNHFIRPVDAGTFVSENGKLRMHQTGINPLFRSHFDAACAYFGVAGSSGIEQALPTTTPFVMSAQVARELLDQVEQREGRDFMAFFLQNRAFNEFYFYHAYILSRANAFETLYEQRSKTAVAFFGGAAETPDRIKHLMPALDRSEICCTGVHRHILEVGLKENLQALASMWQRFGLVQTQQEIDYFQTYVPAVKSKRFWFF